MKKIILSMLAAALALPAFSQNYKVGDYYPMVSGDISSPEVADKIEGIVFEVSEDGQHGKIFSLKEASGLKWSVNGGADYTDDKENGQNNLDAIQAIEPDFEGYPAFAWCASLGSSWYIPSSGELLKIRQMWGPTLAARRQINKKITAIGGIGLSSSIYVKAKDAQASAYYVSSTEHPEKRAKILCVSFNSNSEPADALKKATDSAENLVFRAVKAF